MKRKYSLWLEKEAFQSVVELAERDGKTIPAVVRKAIDAYLKKRGLKK